MISNGVGLLAMPSLVNGVAWLILRKRPPEAHCDPAEPSGICLKHLAEVTRGHSQRRNAEIIADPDDAVGTGDAPAEAHGTSTLSVAGRMKLHRLICHYSGLTFCTLAFTVVAWFMMNPATDEILTLSLTPIAMAPGLLLGSILELICQPAAWTPKDCPQHELRLRWNLIGLYYECKACGRRWLTRQSWHVLRLLGSIAVWLAASSALTVGLFRLLTDVMPHDHIFLYVTSGYCLLMLAVPALANYLAYLLLKDKPPQDRIGRALSRNPSH